MKKTIARKLFATAAISAASLAITAGAEQQSTNKYLDEAKGDVGWYQVGPGELVTLRTRQDISGDPSDAATRVVSVVNRPWHEAVWVGGSFWVSEEARKGEVLCFEWRTDHPFTQLVKIEDSTGLAGIWNLGVGTQWSGVWINIRSPHQLLGQGMLKDVARVEFSSFVHPPHNNELSEVFVKNIRVLPIEPIPVAGRDWKAAARAPEAPGYRAGVTIHNIGRGTDFPGINIPEGLAMAKEVVEHLYGIYGKSVSVSTAYPGGDWGRDFADFMREKGLYYASEGHISGGLGNLDRLGALQKDRFGNTYKDYPGVDGTHGEDLTNKDWLEWAKGMVNASATAGARDWRAIDYVWPCHGGIAWGYTESTKNFFRDALLGRGTGLETVGPDGKPRVMRFAEYYRHYMGYDPSLADIGIERWEDYEPPMEGNGNFRHWQMHDLLVSYAWVVAMNELGRDANAIGGLLMKPVLNPENIETGTDM